MGEKSRSVQKMPDIFNKDKKINIIEYGENCSSFPLWDRIKDKISIFLKH